MSFVRFAAPVFVLALALTSCGSDSESTDTTAAPPTTGTSTSSTALTPQPVSNWTFTPNGIGGLTAGQTVAQAEAASGQTVSFEGDQKCGADISNAEPLSAFFEPDGKLVAVYLFDSTAFSTDKGISVGSTLAEAKAAYPSAEEVEATYGPRLIVKDPNTQNELTLEFREGTEVTAITVGGSGVSNQDEFCG